MSTGPHNSYPRLLADIGGTNARFALEIAPSVLEDVAVLSCTNYSSFSEAMSVYLEQKGAAKVVHAAIGVANPVTGDRVQMTNHHWNFSIEETRRAMGLTTLVVINDFSALALSLPYLPRDELRQLGGEKPIDGEAIALIGPGTGLGVSGLLFYPGGMATIAGEGGHVSFSPVNDDEVAVWQYARVRFGHVSAERLLSGQGLSLIYEALTVHYGGTPEQWQAADITSRALEGECSRCLQAVDVFLAMLGTVASNLALTLGARGGVYIGGGIVPRLSTLLEPSIFRTRFEDKGRFREYLAAIPVFVIESACPALVGASVALNAYLEKIEHA